MADKSVFDSKNIAQATIDQRGLLEELNVPPAAIAFIRGNAKALQALVVFVVIALLGWSAYDHYREGQMEKSAALLAKATGEKSEEQRKAMIEDLLSNYPRTDAAMWGKMELGHMAFQKDNFEQAIAYYSEALGKMSSDNPMAPMAQYSLAQAYEANKDTDNAIKHYLALTGSPGFAAEGYQALGRIYENQGQGDKAKEAFQKALEQQELPPDEREMLEVKLARMK